MVQRVCLAAFQCWFYSTPAPAPCPLEQVTSPTGSAGDRFGRSFAVAGDWLVVGADLADAFGDYSGAAYVYSRDGAGWKYHSQLDPGDLEPDYRFGHAVHIDGDGIVVSAAGADPLGFVYVFRLIDGDWVTEAKLSLELDELPDNVIYGDDVVITNDWLAVSVYFADDGVLSARINMHKRNAGEWQLTQQLLPYAGGDLHFGRMLSTFGPYLMSAGWGESWPGGMTYVFSLDAVSDQWDLDTVLSPGDLQESDYFGASSSMDDDLLVVSASWVDDQGEQSGAAYVFRWEYGAWYQEAKLYATDGQAGDEFASSVSVENGKILIGAWTSSVNGLPTGSAYLFEYLDGNWTQSAKLTPELPIADALFGQTVLLDNGVALVAAPGSQDGAGTIYRSVAADDDCNNNGMLDLCEIELDAALDLDADLVPDECIECTGTIIASLPTSGTIDARQPNSLNDADVRLGIGSADEPVIITLAPDHMGGALCFHVNESADDRLGPNAIAEVLPIGPSMYEIELLRSISPGAVTSISFGSAPDASTIELISHPANVNADSMSNGSDVLSLINMLNDNEEAPFGQYSLDIDHNGFVNSFDVLRVIDLLNGAGELATWNLTPLPQ